MIFSKVQSGSGPCGPLPPRVPHLCLRATCAFLLAIAVLPELPEAYGNTSETAPGKSKAVQAPRRPKQAEVLDTAEKTTQAAKSESKALQRPAKPKQQLVSNVWVEAEMRQVLCDIMAQTGVQIVVGPGVSSIVSMEAKNMPLENCLERLSKFGSYAFAKIDDYYVLGRDDPRSPLFQFLSKTERIDLNYATADMVRNLLPAKLSQFVRTHKASNTVFIMAPTDLLDIICKLIREIDVAPRQVVVEALVIELSETGRNKFGLDWEVEDGQVTAQLQDLLGGGTYLRTAKAATQVQGVVKALVEKEEAKVLANPRLTSLDGREASIYIGEDQYYSLLTGSANNPYYRLESIKAGVTLRVTPHIGKNGEITMDLRPEVSNVNIPASVAGENNHLPVITRRSAQTSVRIRSGHTLVIGGLLHEETRKVVHKVPIVGDIPLLGMLFRKTANSREQTEVVIFITPRLVEDGNKKTAEAAQVLSHGIRDPLQALRMEESVNGMAKDIAEGNVDGIRARLGDLRLRLRR